ncbi:MAG: 3-phosphoshikimate 1-carboxyvinyltransferase [Phycisphaerales bacterium]
MDADPLRITPFGRFRASLTPPGSKSLTNRALLLAALADGTSTITNTLDADDTRVMVEALRTLGVAMEHGDAVGALSIEGGAGRFVSGGRIDIHNAGTAARFLAAAATRAIEPVEIDGVPRMRHRPIGELVDALAQLGASIEYLGEPGFPPLRIHPTDLIGGELELGETQSSQFISALLHIGPFCEEGLTIRSTAPRLTSPTYVAMTLGLMDRFGARISADADLRRIRVEPGGYKATKYTVEPDATSATYWLALAALHPGAVLTIEGLGKGSLQGDAGFADVLARMGAGLTFGRDFITVIGAETQLAGLDVDLSAMPDAAMTLAVVAAFARGESVIRGLRTLRYKETDRLGALENELTKLGAQVEIEDDEVLVIEPDGDARDRTDKVTIATYDDHRMAMSFAIAGTVREGVSIADPGCVEKTYPGFWNDLDRVRSTASDS